MPINFLSVFLLRTYTVYMTVIFMNSQIFILVTLSGDLHVISYLGVILYCIVIKEIREAPKLTEIACIKFWKTIVKTIYMAI
jgi:hypothetical protein